MPEYVDLRDFDKEYCDNKLCPDSLRYVVDEGNWNLSYAKPGDVGLDLPVIINPQNPKFAPKVKPDREYYINTKDELPWIDIPGNGSAELYTGIRVLLPSTAWGNIKSRSSTGWIKRLEVLEGVIDSQYTGPLFILVRNPNNEPVRIFEGERLAQLILVPKHIPPVIAKVNSLPETVRGDTGFGSTNK